MSSPLRSGGGGLLGKSVDLPRTCHPSAFLIIFAYWQSEVRRLLLDLDPYGGTDQLSRFLLFIQRTDVLALYRPSSCSSGLFPGLLHGDDDVTRIPKGPPSSYVANYRPISITLGSSKPLKCLSVWCWFVSGDLCKAVVCFQPPSLLIGMVWVPDALLCVTHTLQSAFEMGLEARIAQIDLYLTFPKHIQQTEHSENKPFNAIYKENCTKYINNAATLNSYEKQLWTKSTPHETRIPR